jgi:hypothetical protein
MVVALLAWWCDNWTMEAGLHGVAYVRSLERYCTCGNRMLASLVVETLFRDSVDRLNIMYLKHSYALDNDMTFPSDDKLRHNVNSYNKSSQARLKHASLSHKRHAQQTQKSGVKPCERPICKWVSPPQ